MLTKTFRATLIAVSTSLFMLGACAPTQEIEVSDVEQSPPLILQTPPAGQLPDGVTPKAYRLDLITDPAADSFSGRVEIDIQLDTPHKRIWLHSLDQRILSVGARLLDGTELVGTFTGNQAEGGVSRLDFETPLPTGRSTLILSYEAPYNFGLAGLYKATQKGRPYLATQMEPIDARRMVPSFDEPRFKTPWTLTVTAPPGQQVITNAPLKAQTTLESGQIQHAFATTRTIQSYLIALAVGPYDLRDGGVLAGNQIRAKSVAFRGFAPAGKGEQLTEAMDITPAMLNWQEAYFDYPYPYAKLDLIAVPDFAYGAMENAGAIIYREGALLMDERTSLARRRGILTTHAHELAHQWYGNLVTPRWWDDIWLNEAFATWMSYKTLDAVYPGTGFDLAPQRAAIGVMDADSLINARQIRNPITRNADILDAFDGITYRKGGGVLSMFETYLGETAFRSGMRLHMRRFEDGVADVNDFMSSLAEGSGNLSVIDSFNSFILQPGIPALAVSLNCAAPDAGLIAIKQSRYAPLGSEIDRDGQSWKVPFAIRMSGPNGERTARFIMTDKTHEMALDGGCPDWIMPNAGGTGYWRFNLDADAWTALIANYAELTAGEQLSFADNITAAFASDSLSATALLDALAANASGDWGAAADPLSNLQAYYAGMTTPESQAAFRDFVTDIYAARWSDFSAAEDAELSQGDALFKARLYATLIALDALPEDRATLIADAHAYIGYNQDPDPDALAADRLTTALKIAIQDGDADVFQAVLNFARANPNQRERRTMLYTLAEFGDEADVLALMDATLGDDFQGQEAWGVALAALRNAAVEAEIWTRFQTNFDAMIARTPEVRKPQTGRAVAAFCTDAQIDAAVAFLESKADMIAGYERRLAQAAESARLCAAFRATKIPELETALKARQDAL